jgi:Cu-Zn family superoxide dismutase
MRLYIDRNEKPAFEEDAPMSSRRLVIAAALLAPALFATSAFAQTVTKAHADLMDAKGTKVGTATITAEKTGVKITANFMGLPPGMHALHIHNVGKCDAPDFMTAGGHFNPAMKQHGKDNPMGAHAGDLPNFTVDAKGKGKASVTDTEVSLGDGANSLFHSGGTALMVHAMPDDYKTDPTGNAGARIACGIIEK